MAISFSRLGQHGRLGNTLFQAAATIALALRNNDKYIFPTWPDSGYFHFDNCFSSGIRPARVYEEPSFSYSPIKYYPDLDLRGYFQSEKYFKDREADIRKMFTPRFRPSFQPDAVSIHVRRGDYLGFPDHHPVLGMDYYERAIEITGGDRFIVFSDDVPWCKQHFVGERFEFSEGRPPHVDLALMASCGGHIIANSSFSWWGAWLAGAGDKKVVAPRQWFGPALAMHSTVDLIPSGWMVI